MVRRPCPSKFRNAASRAGRLALHCLRSCELQPCLAVIRCSLNQIAVPANGFVQSALSAEGKGDRGVATQHQGIELKGALAISDRIRVSARCHAQDAQVDVRLHVVRFNLNGSKQMASGLLIFSSPGQNNRQIVVCLLIVVIERQRGPILRGGLVEPSNLLQSHRQAEMRLAVRRRNADRRLEQRESFADLVSQDERVAKRAE